MKFYIYSNTDQVYSALTNNAITSYANTIENLRHKTLSFMSDNFVFISKSLLPKSYRCWKNDDIYFPVVIEVDFSGVDYIPGYSVSIFDGKATISQSIINVIGLSEDTVGAFICGEIPFSYVSGVLFENEENQIRFRKPSSDLWFPENLYKIIDVLDTESEMSIEQIVELSKSVDLLISEEEKREVSSIVNKRNRYKGLCYFALRETKDWQTDNLKSNLDAYIIQLLDGKQGENGILYKAFNEKVCSLKDMGYDVPLLNEVKETDEILLNSTSENFLDKKVLEIAIKLFYNFDKDLVSVSREYIEDIRKNVLAECSGGNINCIFDIIASFLSSSDMNPQKVLDKLDGYPVFKALMMFLDSSDNDGFMKYGCELLNQYERRYAYMMFGALKGMRFVEREQKSNCALEHRLEEIALKKFSSKLMISTVSAYSGENSTYGIDIKCSYWMSKNTTLSILSDAANIEMLKAVYEIAVKDKAFKLEKLECFEKPCLIFLCEGTEDNNAIKVEVKTVDDLKKQIKDIKLVNEYTRKHPMTIQYDLFLKKYIQDDEWYSALFAKYYSDIQQICRRK